MVAAFRDFDIGVVFGRQAYALRRDQAGERIMRLRQVRMNGGHDFGQCVRAGNREHLRVRLFNDITVLFCAETAGNDDLAVFGKRFTNRVQRLFHRAVDKTAGVDDNKIGCVIGWRNLIALRPELRQNLFGVNQRLGAAE